MEFNIIRNNPLKFGIILIKEIVFLEFFRWIPHSENFSGDFAFFKNKFMEIFYIFLFLHDNASNVKEHNSGSVLI